MKWIILLPVKKHVLVVTVIALIFLLIGGFFFLQRNKKSVFSSGLKNNVYFTAQPRTIKNTVTLSGSVDAEKKRHFTFKHQENLCGLG